MYSEQVCCEKLPRCLQAGLLSLFVVISVCLYLFADSVNVEGYWSTNSAINYSDLSQRLAVIAVCYLHHCMLYSL